MKIVKQSFEILDDIPDIVKQIGNRSRICYKSEDQATETEEDLVKKVIAHGHNSCLEMAVIHAFMPYGTDRKTMLALKQGKFLTTNSFGVSGFLVTGSVRAFREFFQTWGLDDALKTLLFRMAERYPLLFDLPGVEMTDSYSNIRISTNLDQMPHSEHVRLGVYKKHKHQAVKIITNRAVTHEIVRHRPCSFLQESQRYCRYSDNKFGNEVTFIDPSAFFKKGGVDYAIWKSACSLAEDSYLLLLDQEASPQAARTVLPNSCKTEIIIYTSLREWEHIFAMRAANKAAEPSMREIMTPLHEAFMRLYPGCFEVPQRSIG